jgi:uncharacterized damage-inducible protein DinB
MLPGYLQDLMRHMEWADCLVWNSVLTLPDAQSDSDMRERLHHMHTVQWVYLQIWRGEPIDMRDLLSFKDLRAMHAWVRDYYHTVPDYFATVDAEALGQEVQLPWSDHLVERWGSARPTTLAETILQVNYHTTYHRGQVNTRLRQLGGEPPLTDFIAWIWMGRAAAEWE